MLVVLYLISHMCETSSQVTPSSNKTQFFVSSEFSRKVWLVVFVLGEFFGSRFVSSGLPITFTLCRVKLSAHQGWIRKVSGGVLAHKKDAEIGDAICVRVCARLGMVV